MSDISRRTLIQLPAFAAAAAAAAQEAPHDHGSQSSSFARPPRTVFLADHEFATLEKLCDCILPADEVSPAASAAGAPEYIELLCSGNARLAQIFHGGLAWLDTQSRVRCGANFAGAPPAEQIALLELIADKRQATAEYKAGVEFFDWARRMTVDAFYTTPHGYRDVDYKGGKGMTQYETPAAALAQALQKANLK